MTDADINSSSDFSDEEYISRCKEAGTDEKFVEAIETVDSLEFIQTEASGQEETVFIESS